MKITKLGVIMATKNIGVFIASWTIAGIATNTAEFCLGLITYALISVPSDLYMLNKMETNSKKAALMGTS